VGTPDDYLRVQRDILTGLLRPEEVKIET